MKLVICITAIIVGSFIGFYKSNFLKIRVIQLQEILIMLEKIQTFIKYERLQTSNIIKFLSEDKNLSNLNFLKDINLKEKNLPKEWEKAIVQNKTKMNLEKNDIKLLLRIGQILGSSDVKTQISQYETVNVMLINYINEAEKNYNDNGKLYRSLGVLGGVFVAVLLV